MNRHVLYSDDQLVNEIKTGNVFCFDILYKKYSRKIYSFAFSILKSGDEAENVTQDVFLILWENRHRIEKCSAVKCYLYTIAYNSAMAIIRRKTREQQFVDYLLTLPESDRPDETIEYDDLLGRIEKIVTDLPSRQKEVFVLHRKEGMKYREISEKLNISVNTIENHMSAALKTIRKKLAGILYIFF